VWLPASDSFGTSVWGAAPSLGACTLRVPCQDSGPSRSRSPTIAEAAGMDGLHGAGPAGLSRFAAAAGHGIVNESDDIVANWRQELPGGDLHGSGKGILAN
jgi:hypothetical protein